MATFSRIIFACMIFAGTIICLAMPAAITAQDSSAAPQGLDTKQQKTQSIVPPAAVRNQQNREAILKSLTGELLALIPEKIEKDSAKFEILRQVSELFVEGNIKAVKFRSEELVSKSTDYPPSELLLAGLHYGASETEKGRKVLEDVAVAHPDHPAISLALSRLAFSQLRFSDALALIEKAERQLDKVKFGDSTKRFYETQIADTHTGIAMRQNRLKDAQRYGDVWRKLAPESTKMLLMRGEIEFLLGNLDGAMKELQTLKKLIPETRPPEIIIASWFQKKNDDANVAKWVKLALDRHPDDAGVQLEYGNWALSMEDFPTAKKFIEKFETVNGTSDLSTLMKARIAFAKEDYDVAERYLDSLFTKQPGSFDISNLYALCLAENPDVSKLKIAFQIAQRNVRALPNNAVALAALGWVMMRNGDVNNGSAILKRAARSAELPPEVTYFVANMLVRDGRTMQAKTILEPVLKTKGMFLYRQAANRLLKELENESSLPEPNDPNGKK